VYFCILGFHDNCDCTPHTHQCLKYIALLRYSLSLIGIDHETIYLAKEIMVK